MSPKRSLLTVLVALLLFASACGSDDATTNVEAADGGDAQSQTDTSQTDAATSDEPIPVEPDGGIGDGAEPLPGAEEPVDEGTWHGEEVAVTNCPGTEWKRVQASAFSFSVPADFFENDVQPIDSEVGVWTGGNKIEVTYDYGWYSGSIRDMPGAENEAVDYSGIVGERTIIRDGEGKSVGIYFGEVAEIDGQVDKLSMLVRFTDANDEIIGRCIVGSISFEGQ